MTVFFIPNPAQCLYLTNTLPNINKQQIGSLLKQMLMVC